MYADSVKYYLAHPPRNKQVLFALRGARRDKVTAGVNKKRVMRREVEGRRRRDVAFTTARASRKNASASTKTKIETPRFSTRPPLSKADEGSYESETVSVSRGEPRAKGRQEARATEVLLRGGGGEKRKRIRLTFNGLQWANFPNVGARRLSNRTKPCNFRAVAAPGVIVRTGWSRSPERKIRGTAVVTRPADPRWSGR